MNQAFAIFQYCDSSYALTVYTFNILITNVLEHLRHLEQPVNSYSVLHVKTLAKRMSNASTQCTKGFTSNFDTEYNKSHANEK